VKETADSARKRTFYLKSAKATIYDTATKPAKRIMTSL